jgi:hypothetical protein
MGTEYLLDLSNTKPDFESFVSKLQSNLKNRESWTDLSLDSTGQTLIDYNAAIGTLDQWAIEKAFKESFLGTATRDSSIYACARMLGVRISRKLPGVQKCNLTRVNKVNLPITSALEISAYNQFYINDSIPFFNRTILNFIAANNELNSIQLNQGLVLTKTLISDGSPFLQVTLTSLSPFSISDSDVSVTVDGNTWDTIQDGLWRYGINDTKVEDSTLGNGDVILQFGNGVNGKIPPSGSIIKITYVETLGSKQSLIANYSPITSAFTQDGFIIEGEVIKDNSVNLANINIAACQLSLSSTTDPILKVSLPVGYNWDLTTLGLQLDGSPGLGLIVSIQGRVATLSIVSTFSDLVLPAGSWTLSLPATGYDEKSSDYYKVISPSLRKAGNRAVTPSDHSALFLSYPGISDVLVRTEKDLHPVIQATKSPNTIAREIALGIHTSDTYEIIASPHPALYNVIWVSLLTQTGVTLSESEKLELLDWFSEKQLSGSIVRIQDPVKKEIALYITLRCNLSIDPILAKNTARALILDVFKTNKRVLSKRVTVSDLYSVLSDKMSVELDSFEIFYLELLTSNPIPLTDEHLIPEDAGISANGFPTPPGYLSLTESSLLIESYTTNR